MEKMNFQIDLLNWYEQHHRNLPWRENHDPYRIWISEIMLQQTQVVTVISYFNRFIAAYPTVFSLALAHEDEVFKLWEGLGYYSRARNLLRCAQRIVSEHQGQFPQDLKTLLKLPGIGPYTAGAILSIAFNAKVPAVDGNVLRVYSRLCSSSADIGDPKTRLMMEEKVLADLPEDRRHFNQALMELGATVCTPKSPLCEECPISRHCLALSQNLVSTLPIKEKKLKRSYYTAAVAYVTCGEQVLLIKRPPDGLLAGLWGFPSAELAPEASPQAEIASLTQWLSEYMDLEVSPVSANPVSTAKHVFTHKTWHMHLWHFEAPFLAKTALPEMVWITRQEISNYPLPTAFVKLIEKQKTVK